MKDLIIRTFKSPVARTTLIAQAVIIIAVFNVDFSKTVETILLALSQMVTAVGIANNPADKENW